METFSTLLAICAGNSPVPDDFPAQWPVTWSFDIFLICARINCWVNSSEAGDLRCHRGHYDVNVMNLYLFNSQCPYGIILHHRSGQVKAYCRNGFVPDGTIYHQTSNMRQTMSQNKMFLISSCSCLCLIHGSQVLSREWRCSWSSANRHCSNYIWVIKNFTAH